MSIPILNNLDLTLNQLLNVKFQILASDPGSPVEGMFWFNSTTDSFNFYDGTTVQVIKRSELLARANHTGTQAASTISDFDTQVRTNRLDQMAAPTASVSLNSQKITNLLDPSGAQDAASKAYVDSQTAGARDVKDSVRVATAAALPSNSRSGNVLTASANGALNDTGIDSVTDLALNDRVLVKNESTGANNGLYYVTDLGSAGTPWTLTRTTDADASAEVTGGLFVWANEGTSNADTGWLLTTNDTITLNTTTLTFTQVSALGQVTAGAGLTKTGSTLDVGAGTGITVNANDIQISASYVGQSSITTLGTITTGVWTGTDIAVADGGTGASTAAGAKTNLGFMTRVATNVGDTSATEIDVTHNLGTKDVIVMVYDNNSPYAQVFCDVEMKTTNIVTVRFATAPGTDRYRVVVIG